MKFTTTLLLVAGTTSGTLAAGTGPFTGQMTWYDSEGGLGHNPGACGQVNHRDQAIVAMNAVQFGDTPNPNNNPICGTKIRIHVGGRSAEATVTDRCPGNECAHGDIDVTQSVFLQLVDGLEVGKVEVSWDFI